MFVKQSAGIEYSPVTQGEGVSRQMLISPEEGPNFAMRRYVVQVGGRIVNHTNSVEHEQYVLRGKADIGSGDKVYHVQQGDVVFIPAEQPHWYTNTGDEPFEFLCLVPNKQDDVTVLE